jgi:hypothetical protein
MNAFTFRGAEAVIKWGYHEAAVLGPWEMSAGILTAKVISFDESRTSQPSLTFRVHRANAAPWVWPVESLSIAGDTLSAKLLQE